MSILLLMRHARAGWAEPGKRDYDRILLPEGEDDAVRAGMRLAGDSLFPAHVICSGAARTRQTLEFLCQGMGIVPPETEFRDALYLSDGNAYLEALRGHGGKGPLLMLGHNPMVEDFALALCGSGTEDDLSRIRTGFPAGGVAIIRFDRSFAEASPGKAELLRLLVPGT